MICRRMLQRMNERSHIDRLAHLRSTDDRDNVAWHLPGGYRKLIVAFRAQPSARDDAVTVIQSNQYVIRINVLLLRYVARTDNRFDIIHRIQPKAFTVPIQLIIFPKRIVLVILSVVGSPEDNLFRSKLTETVRAHNVIEQRPWLRLRFFLNISKCPSFVPPSEPYELHTDAFIVVAVCSISLSINELIPLSILLAIRKNKRI